MNTISSGYHRILRLRGLGLVFIPSRLKLDLLCHFYSPLEILILPVNLRFGHSLEPPTNLTPDNSHVVYHAALIKALQIPENV
jgi:hypothetical protein